MGISVVKIRTIYFVFLLVCITFVADRQPFGLDERCSVSRAKLSQKEANAEDDYHIGSYGVGQN